MNKKRVKYIFFALLATLSFAGCFKDDVEDLLILEREDAMQFSTSLADFTRSSPLENGSASRPFLNGDVVKIAKRTNELSSSFSDFVSYSYDGARWNGSSLALEHVWGEQTEYRFTAIYPSAAIYDLTTSEKTFTLPLDQGSVDKIETADFMLCEDVLKQKNVDDYNVTLDLQRQTSRIIIEVIENNSLLGLQASTLKIGSKFEKYEANVLTQNASGTTSFVTPYFKAAIEGVDGAEGSNASYTALVMPEAEGVNPDNVADFKYLDDFVVLDLGGGETLTKGLGTRLEPGYSYTFKLSIGDELELVGEPLVEPWLGSLLSYDSVVKTYYIYNAQDLNEFAMLVSLGHNDIDGILMNDIDLATDASRGTWIPIGTGTYPYMGTFESQQTEPTAENPTPALVQYTISNLSILNTNEEADYHGLFGYADGATFNNFSLDSGTVETKGDNVGLFAGKIANTTLTNCAVLSNRTSKVVGVNKVGGLVGEAGADVVLINSAIVLSEIDVVGNMDVGGLAGYVSAGENVLVIPDMFNFTVTGTGDNVGGTVGRLGAAASLNMVPASSLVPEDGESGDSSESKPEGLAYTSVVKGINNVGGVIGLIEDDSAISGKPKTTISEAWTTDSSSVTGERNVGGIIGAGFAATTVIEAVRNDATIIGVDNIGGIAGISSGDIVACYNTGNVLYYDYDNVLYSYATENVGSTIMGGIAGEVRTNGAVSSADLSGRIVGCFNVGNVLVKAVASHPKYENHSHEGIMVMEDQILPETSSVGNDPDQYYGFRGDGIVGEVRNLSGTALHAVGTDGGEIIYNCYYNDGGIDADIDYVNPLDLENIDINNYQMTNTGLRNQNLSGNGITLDQDAENLGVIAPVNLMNVAIQDYYGVTEKLESKYFIDAVSSVGTVVSLGGPEDYPYIAKPTGGRPSSKIIGGQHTGPNAANIINSSDALVLISAISLRGMGYEQSEITQELKDQYEIKYAQLYVDINLLVDVDFGALSKAGFESRIQGAFFGTFDGHNRFIEGYSGNDPFFTSLGNAGNNIGEFKNVTFVDPMINTEEGAVLQDNVGVILGTANFGTIIDNCNVIGGVVKGRNNVGAIIGRPSSDITNCTVIDTEVTGETRVGGIAGYLELTKADNQTTIADLFLGSTNDALNIVPFGAGSSSSADVTATAANGIAGGLIGQTSADMDDTDGIFTVESQEVHFSGTVRGNTVGSIAGVIELAQPRINFHGIENSGTVIGTGTAPTVGGLVGIGRIIAPGSLTEGTQGETITSLTIKGKAMSNIGEIVMKDDASVGGMIGKIDLNGALLTNLTSYVDGGYETIRARAEDGSVLEPMFVIFTGNAGDLKTEINGRGGDVLEYFDATWIHPLPDPVLFPNYYSQDGEGNSISPFGELPADGTVSAEAILDMNRALAKTDPETEMQLSPFRFDNAGILYRME